MVQQAALASHDEALAKKAERGWEAPSARAVKILVANDGWYRITRAQLASAGFDPGTNARKLQLFADGLEQAIEVNDGGDGVFGPTDAIEFYGVGIDSPYDAAHVYWLLSKESGQRIETRPSTSQLPAPAAFPFTLERKDRTVYFSSLTNNGDAENFFGPIISTDPETQDIDVVHFDITAGGSSQLEIALQGGTEGAPHLVEVQVNGYGVGTVSFQQPGARGHDTHVPNAILHEGSNQVTMVLMDGDDDISVIDYVRLTYPHVYQLDSGALRMTAPGGTRITIQGLSDTSLRVVDVSNP